MKKAAICVMSALALGVALGTSTASAADAVLHVPGDVDFSETRATGHYEVEASGTGLHIWTEGATSTDKVAGYVATNVPLAGIGEPSLEYTATLGIAPGYQLVVDFDGNGTPDGILVGEPTFYGANWWLTNSAAAFVKADAPHTGGGNGSDWFGTLDEWRASFPGAVVKAFGFSLGSGVHGDGVLEAINFNGTHYTFAATVVLAGKDACKNHGWETSTAPVFKNQGDCVSYFASKK